MRTHRPLHSPDDPLPARAPYFHDGSAATVLDIVNFYDRRFAIGLNDQQKQDMVNFLNAL